MPRSRTRACTQVLARHEGAKTLLDLVDLGVDNEVTWGYWRRLSARAWLRRVIFAVGGVFWGLRDGVAFRGPVGVTPPRSGSSHRHDCSINRRTTVVRVAVAQCRALSYCYESRILYYYVLCMCV